MPNMIDKSTFVRMLRKTKPFYAIDSLPHEYSFLVLDSDPRTDIRMTRWNGYDIYRHISSLYGTAHYVFNLKCGAIVFALVYDIFRQGAYQCDVISDTVPKEIIEEEISVLVLSL